MISMTSLMKKALLSSAMMIGSSSLAQAELAAPLWVCKLKATVQDSSAAVILGVVHIEGTGKLKCLTALGQETSRPVALQITGLSVGPEIALPTGQPANLDVVSAGFGLASINAIYGDYHATAAGNLRVGSLKASTAYNFLSFTPSLRNGAIAQNIDFAIEQGGVIGLGANVSITGMRIRPLR